MNGFIGCIVAFVSQPPTRRGSGSGRPYEKDARLIVVPVFLICEVYCTRIETPRREVLTQEVPSALSSNLYAHTREKTTVAL